MPAGVMQVWLVTTIAKRVVPGAGLEPARLAAGDFESGSGMAQPCGLQKNHTCIYI